MISKDKIVSLMDLTILGDNDCEQDITNLCKKADNKLGKVAALCVHKQFIGLVKEKTYSEFGVATVINFPMGGANLQSVLAETKQALALGADEIDLVVDYKEYNRLGESPKSCEIVAAVKKLCGNKILKVIIESGELHTQELVEKASTDAITNGANFIKTSTGKSKTGATLKATETMLSVIKKLSKNTGFKASGGIRTYEEACEYIKLAQNILSEDFVKSETFRFGVSGLLDNLLNDGKVKNGY